MPTGLPTIPRTITVHLGAPSASAPNVTLPFIDYIKNVASSEIYPTWPENAIRANIYAQVSFALNRVYTEYYRTRGYDFDITNSTAYDQSFVRGRDIFANISALVDELFTDYIRRRGTVQPLFAQYCNGTTVQCDGLSQWGTVDLAEQGLTPYQILQAYYGDDIDIVRDAPVAGATASVPAVPLRLGSSGDDVRTLQIRLNRIGRNYPSIPKISEVTGLFSFDTEAAVEQFQRIFDLTPDGVVGRATWNRIGAIWSAVMRLADLDAEGITLADVSKQFPSVLRLGSRGDGVRTLQYFLRYLAQFEDEIPAVAQDGVYGSATEAAVRAFQQLSDLPVDGVVGETTWNALYRGYLGAIAAVGRESADGYVAYGGVPLVLGAQAEEVALLQAYLNVLAEAYPSIPTLPETGVFGRQTRAAVEAAQAVLGLAVNGVVGALTWDAIARKAVELTHGNVLNDGQYPGYVVGEREG